MCAMVMLSLLRFHMEIRVNRQIKYANERTNKRASERVNKRMIQPVYIMFVIKISNGIHNLMNWFEFISFFLLFLRMCIVHSQLNKSMSNERVWMREMCCVFRWCWAHTHAYVRSNRTHENFKTPTNKWTALSDLRLGYRSFCVCVCVCIVTNTRR